MSEHKLVQNVQVAAGKFTVDSLIFVSLFIGFASVLEFAKLKVVKCNAHI